MVSPQMMTDSSEEPDPSSEGDFGEVFWSCDRDVAPCGAGEGDGL